MLKEMPKVSGKLTLTLYDKDNNIKNKINVDNLVVNTGLSYIASRMVNTSSTVMSHMGVGTSSTATNVSQTALLAQVSRVALTGTTPVGSTITYSTTFTAGQGTGSLNEAGIFNASSGGTMLCRTVFPTLVKEADDILTINWLVTIS